MSFKFKLGEIVVLLPTSKTKDLPPQPSEVVAIQLGGYVVVNPLGTHSRILVHSNDYQIFEKETLEFHY